MNNHCPSPDIIVNLIPGVINTNNFLNRLIPKRGNHFKVYEHIRFQFVVISETRNQFKKRGESEKPVVTHLPVGMHVSDVWESEEALNKFSETLIPILKKNGVTPARPTVTQVHNIIA